MQLLSRKGQHHVWIRMTKYVTMLVRYHYKCRDSKEMIFANHFSARPCLFMFLDSKAIKNRGVHGEEMGVRKSFSNSITCRKNDHITQLNGISNDKGWNSDLSTRFNTWLQWRGIIKLITLHAMRVSAKSNSKQEHAHFNIQVKTAKGSKQASWNSRTPCGPCPCTRSTATAKKKKKFP